MEEYHWRTLTTQAADLGQHFNDLCAVQENLLRGVFEHIVDHLDDRTFYILADVVTHKNTERSEEKNDDNTKVSTATKR